MDPLTTDPRKVVAAIDTLMEEAAKRPASVRSRPTVMALLREARKEAATAPAGQVFLPRTAAASQVQSAMAAHERALEALPPFEPFSNSDPGWTGVVLALLDRLIRGRAPFVDAASSNDFRIPLAADARLALFSDWGTGQPAAQRVATHIDASNPTHLIHLGDIYYAGEEHEVPDRFLSRLPSNPSIQARFALNANHEMYSGGHGYFSQVLPAFGQPASYFCLENEHWRIIGLDTAYDDKRYHGRQIEWLRGILATGAQKNILLTHHQPFSIYERRDVDGDVMGDVADLLDAGKIHAWFWGHEHKHIIYRRHRNVLGRCIGHGAIPYSPPSRSFPPGNKIPVQFVNRRTTDGAHCMNGFATMELDGPRMVVRYIDDDGFVPFEENLEFEIATQAAAAGR